MREENILEKVRETIAQFHMITAGDTVVVGVSGGPDSVCLLDILCRLAENSDFRLQVVHVNHLLRPEAQEEEQTKRAGLQPGPKLTISAARHL